MKYYKLRFGWNPEIKEVEVEKESESSVWINGKSYRKDAGSEIYLPTKEKCIDYFKQQAEKSIAIKEESIIKQKAELAKFLKENAL